MASPWNKRRGFTLMEVLIALVVLSLVGVVLVQTTQTTTSQASYLKQKVLAVWVAQDRATMMRLAVRSGQPVNLDKETVEQGGMGFRTQALLEKQTGDLNRVEIQVFLTDAQSPLYTLVTYVPELTSASGVTNE